MDEIKSIFANISWASFSLPRVRLNDLLDMLVIAFLVYKVLLWVKETRAWSLIKGLVIILVVFILSSVLEMRAVGWLIENSFNIGLLAVLVIFQPELRKLLIEIGEGRINRFFAVVQRDFSLRNAAVFEIVRAAEYMSERRIGALIVLENEVTLSEIENEGVPLDAVCTNQLLINIFTDKTPLHDGAVIIRDNRITSASCILPLTEKEIDRELGTRHRAAIGMSESSDADVIVVSEESGAVSVANNGILYRDLHKDAIIEMLSKGEKSNGRFKVSRRRRPG